MKIPKALKVASIACSILGLCFASYGLFGGLLSIGATGIASLGVIFIIPSVAAFAIILCDLLVTISKIKNGFAYSCVSSALKVLIIMHLVPVAIYDHKMEMMGNLSNWGFDLMLITLLLMIAFPSALNIIRLFPAKKINAHDSNTLSQKKRKLRGKSSAKSGGDMWT